jgi:two-component system LytT family response regulator
MKDGPRFDVLIVDDEPLGRRGVRELLAGHADIGVVREATNGREAVRAVRQQPPDLVFLDIKMPGLDGFGVIEEIGIETMPPVIFVTAYEEHAVKAFEVHAVDYLLKPIEPNRFQDALERVRTAAVPGGAARRDSLARLLPLLRRAIETPGSVPAPPVDDRIAVRRDGRIQLVSTAEIDWIEARGNYVRIHCRAGPLLHRAPLDQMAARLGASFLRIRRSLLVRAGAIRYCESLGRGSYVLVLHDNTRLTSSRYFRHRLAPLLGE